MIQAIKVGKRGQIVLILRRIVILCNEKLGYAGQDEYFGVSYATVSRAMKQAERKG